MGNCFGKKTPQQAQEERQPLITAVDTYSTDITAAIPALQLPARALTLPPSTFSNLNPSTSINPPWQLALNTQTPDSLLGSSQSQALSRQLLANTQPYPHQIKIELPPEPYQRAYSTAESCICFFLPLIIYFSKLRAAVDTQQLLQMKEATTTIMSKLSAYQEPADLARSPELHAAQQLDAFHNTIGMLTMLCLHYDPRSRTSVSKLPTELLMYTIFDHAGVPTAKRNTILEIAGYNQQPESAPKQTSPKAIN